MSSHGDGEPSGRPKLNLQPRTSSPDLPSPATPAKSTRPSPFGAARPREQVIAERKGKKETEVLKELATREWKPQTVLTEAQNEEKKAAEAELAFAKSELEKENDTTNAGILQQEVTLKERKLAELLASFEKLAVQTPQAGGTRRSFDKRRDENFLPSVPMPYSGAYGGREVASSEDGFSNFRSPGQELGERVASYGDTWGGGRAGKSVCYTCGEIGHFSRECPRGGSYGGNFGGGKGIGGRQCYTCGQEGHFSRECPQSQGAGYGSRGGGYGGTPSYGSSFGGSRRDYDGDSYGMGSAGYHGNGYDAISYESARGANYSARRDYTGQGDR